MAAGPPGAGVPHRRRLIGFWLGCGILINYVARMRLSVAGPQMLPIPVGIVLDRFGVMRIGPSD